MRLDSPRPPPRGRRRFVLVLAGTLAIHALFLGGANAVIALYPREPATPTPRIELVDIEVPPVLQPPPPPVREPEPEARPPEPQPAPKPAPQPRAVRAVQPARPAPPAEPPPAAPPPPPQAPAPDPGGAPTVSMPDIAPAATGVAVAPGPRNTGKVGRGGSGDGTGTGTGTGAGSGEPTPVPVSIAAIKTRALPKGDYGYIDAGKDYPPEARQLGIEGTIRVRLTVDDKGKVKAAVLLNKLGHGLDELALARARQIEFEPAKDAEDRPVSSVVVWTFNMTLPK